MSDRIKMIIAYVVCIVLLPFVIYFSINFLSSSGTIPAFTEIQISLVTNIIVYTILPILAIIILRKKMLDDLKKLPNYLKWIIPAIILLYGTAILSGILVNFIDNTTTTSNQTMISAMQQNSFIITFIIAAISGPIAEESTFRYALISDKSGGMRALFLFISSILFGLVHQQAGFSVGSLIAYSLLGFVFGCYYIRSNNLIFNILTHIGYNTLSLLLMTLLNNYIPAN